MTQPKIAVSTEPASIRTSLFAGAANRYPAERIDFESFSDFAEALEDLVTREAEPLKPEPGETPKVHAKRIKATLPYLAPYHLADGARRCDANVEALTLLVSDFDACDLDTLIDRMFDLEVEGAIYASPSDDTNGPGDKRRVRVIVPVSREILPSECEHTRLAFAELVGLGPGCGADGVLAESIGFFAGRMPGSPAREFYKFEGGAIDVDALVSSPLKHAGAWGKRTTPAGEPGPNVDKSPLPPIGEVESRDTATLEALLAMHLPPGADPSRRMHLRATGSYLADRGLGDERIAALVSRIPTANEPSTNVAQAIEGARDRRAGVPNVAGWKMLRALSSEAATALERATETLFQRHARARTERKEAEAKANAEANDTSEHEPFAPAGSSDGHSVPLFLRSLDGHVVLMWQGDEYGHRPIAEKVIRTQIAKLGFESICPLRDSKRKIPIDDLLEAHSETYVHTAYAFANRVTAYDPSGEGTVTIGYPLTSIASCFDADADAWLRALAGPHYDRLAVWIASCSQAQINRLSACLIVMGRADSGKSMLGHAVARMWGQTPPPLGLVVERFNGDMSRCPILVDEEAQLFGSKALSTKRFRDMVQSGERSIERKGKERAQLVGALRAIVSCNGLSDLRFKDLGGPAVIEALSDRLLVLDATTRADACKGPLARLRLPNDHRVDLDRVARHMAWLCETTALPVERFLGTGGANADGAILAGHVEEHAALWDSFREWLDAGGLATAVWSIRREQGLCVDTAALARTLEHNGRGWDVRMVRSEALAPFHTGDHRPEKCPRLWVLDAARVAAALQLDATERETLGALYDAAELERVT